MVAVQRVSKLYHLYRRPSDRLFEVLPFASSRRRTDFWALRDVSLTAARGEFLAIVGPNGSGKSTLLQILCGIVQPTSGRVTTEGRIAALLELGAGFNPESTGRENVFINGEILGLSRRELERVFPSIAEFADIGGFIDRPVKEYSSGMYVRLAFATAIHVEPEILVVDEALAVGDAAFSNRCIQKFEELKRKGVTVLFVSHDLGLVKRLSDRAIFLLEGRVAAQGSPSDVVNRYVGHVLGREKEGPRAHPDTLETSFRHGDGTSRILEAQLLRPDGAPIATVPSGEPVVVRVRARMLKRTSNPVVGILIRNRLGIDVFGTNTRLLMKDFGNFEPGEELEVSFRFDCLLTQQEYTLTVATQHWDGMSQDWLDDVLCFRVVESGGAAGLVNLGTGIEWKRR
ncbi:MAG: ABC transporter ATP-binding protein [Bryobacteraceae bacterium]